MFDPYSFQPLADQWHNINWDRARFEPTRELMASGVYDGRSITMDDERYYTIGTSPFELAGKQWEQADEAGKARIEGKKLGLLDQARIGLGQNRNPQMAMAQAMMPFGGSLLSGIFAGMGTAPQGGFTGFGNRMFGTNPMFGGAYRNSSPWMQGGQMQPVSGSMGSPLANNSWGA